MFQSGDNRYLDLSITLSLVSIVTAIVINYQIAKVYLVSYGKTRALFGLKELLQFGYQYYIALLALTALIIAIMNTRYPGSTNKKIISLLLSVVAFALIFVRVWRLFI